MVDASGRSSDSSLARRRPFWRWLCLLLLLPALVGCEGCRHDDPEDDEALPVNQFTASAVAPAPSGQAPSDYRLKPGHWLSASKPLQANREDQRGTLEVFTGHVLRDEWGKAQRVAQPVLAQRPAVLPKGQRKRLDFRALAPLPGRIDAREGFFRDRLISRQQGLAYDSGDKIVEMLRPEQYFFVILTSRPERFVSLQVADWVKPPRDINRDESSANPVNYRVVFPKEDDLLPLPDTMLDWTSTAYLLWDDVPIDRLTPAQQQAVVDWLHWGGRILINGRYADQTLAGSPLDPWLPMSAERLGEWEPEAFAAMLESWSVEDDATTVQQQAVVRQSGARVALEGSLRSEAEAVPNTGDLVLSRRVGLGRIVMTRFDLTTDVLGNWASRDSFFNNVLLTRPPRRYNDSGDSRLLLEYADDPTSNDNLPALNTWVRLLARDGLAPFDARRWNLEDDAPAPAARRAASGEADEGRAAPQEPSSRDRSSQAVSSQLAAWAPPASIAEPLGGVGAWTDRSQVATLVLNGLVRESGISIPPPSFVAKSLAWYLVILVPLNYLIFRLFRRLEYAWIAVPLIAIGGAVWVARAARLDIGFARLQNELCVLEMQPGYDRAHLSSFLALYSSLGTDYELAFDTADAVALPVGIWHDSLESDSVRLRFGYGAGPILAGVQVASNQTRLVHAEQILSVGGSIALSADGQALQNDSDLTLEHAFVVRSAGDEGAELAVVRDVASGGTHGLRFSRYDESRLDESWQDGDAARELTLPVRQLLVALSSPDVLRAGEARVVASVSSVPSKLRVEPAANQIDRQSVLVAHLQHAAPPAARPDVNLAPPPQETVDDMMLDQELDASF
ncbi:hypothetical protein [Roseimaritima sediminicola]|uniref:hypothetical protein n=1 Tax=Roseimaritima sediminicola TaxID=2662066 RepID=UPI00129857B5|nr:hypothetical protein [Roseimaritima sediminicola]